MSNVPVQRMENQEVETAPALKALQEKVEMVRQKAFELFERRGGGVGSEFEDWVQAERDLFWVPPAELAETDKEVQITVAVAGFDPKELQVTAQPGEIFVQGKHDRRLENEEKDVSYSEFGEKALYRRFEVAQPIDVGHVTASFENGMLTVKAPKKMSQAASGTKTASAA